MKNPRPVHWQLHQRKRKLRYTGGLRHVTYTPGARADYDPSLMLAAERRTAAALD